MCFGTINAYIFYKLCSVSVFAYMLVCTHACTYIFINFLQEMYAHMYSNAWKFNFVVVYYIFFIKYFWSPICSLQLCHMMNVMWHRSSKTSPLVWCLLVILGLPVDNQYCLKITLFTIGWAKLSENIKIYTAYNHIILGNQTICLRKCDN